LLLAVGAALLAYLVSCFPLADIADACAKAGPGIAITPVVAMGWFTCGARSLSNLLDGAVPLRALVHNRLVGEGYNALLPAAGLGGEPFKHILRNVHAAGRHRDDVRAEARERVDQRMNRAAKFQIAA